MENQFVIVSGGITKHNLKLFSDFPLLSEALLSECLKECSDGPEPLMSLTQLCTESVVRPIIFFETATKHGHIHVCEFLLQNGFPINGKECKYYDSLDYQSTIEIGEQPYMVSYRQPSLMSAIEAGQTATVRWLLEHGADPSLEIDSDWHMFWGNNVDVAIYTLCYSNRFNDEIFRLVVEFCIEHGMENDDWEEMFDTFCSCIDDRDKIDKEDGTPGIHAGLLDSVRWLIEKNRTVANNVYKKNEYEILKEAFLEGREV